MKALLVDPNNDPDWDKVTAGGFDRLYFPMGGMEAPLITRVNDTFARHLIPGLFFDSTWPAYVGDTGRMFGSRVAAEVKALHVFGQVHVQLDMEEHSPGFVVEALTAYRQILPATPTCWTMESGQGGWMDHAFVGHVINMHVRLAPQLYNGAMTEVRDSLTYTRDLTRQGFPDSIVSPYYDAAHLPVGWSGWAFTQGRLP